MTLIVFIFSDLVKVEEDPGDVAEEEDDDNAEEDDGLTVVLVQLLSVRCRSGRTHHLKDNDATNVSILFFTRNNKAKITTDSVKPCYNEQLGTRRNTYCDKTVFFGLLGFFFRHNQLLVVTKKCTFTKTETNH